VDEKERASARLHAVVHGRVQGVSFRYYAARKARSLGLTGWVANRADGSVETVGEGRRAELEEFNSFLHQGPPAAAVEKVVARWESATGEYGDFGVRYI